MMFPGGRGSMFRTVSSSRAALTTRTTGVTIQEPITTSSSSSSNSTSVTSPSATRNNNNLTLSSPASSPNCGPVTTTSGGPNWPTTTTSPQFDDFNYWVNVDGVEEVERGDGYVDDGFVLGQVPSEDEVHNAVTSLQQVFSPTHHPQLIRDRVGSEYLDKDVADQVSSASGSVQKVSSFRSEQDWVEPSAYLCNSRPQECQRVYEAFSLLQNESSVQRMVVSLASDRAVWDAVMNNVVVKELRESFYAAEDNSSESSSENSDDSSTATKILRWIFENTYGKVMEVIENITKLFDDLLQPQGSGKAKAEASDLFEERLKTSVMLSVVVLLVVVVTRSHSA